MRIGIVGAGIAGLTAAWLLDGEHGRGVDAVTVFEADDRLGGHAESVPTGRGHVDLGAQHLSPADFPAHTRLLRRFGLDDQLLHCPLSVTVGTCAEPFVVTPDPDRRPQPTGAAGSSNLEFLGVFLRRATELVDDESSWRVPAEDVVEPLDVPDRVKTDIVYPLLASFVGCPVEEARALSFAAAVAFLVRNPAEDPSQPPPWRNLAGGLGRLADALAGNLRRAEIRTGAVVTEVRRVADGYEVVDVLGRVDTVDHVVFAASPHAVEPLLDRSAVAADLTAALHRFRFVRAVVGVHRDPVYMPTDPRHWSTNNITVAEGTDGNRWAETSTWYGPITGDEVFKSWITHREQLPAELITWREYQHPIPTVDQVEAQRDLRAVQGAGGLHCAGSWTEDVDSQESAVRSALSAARRIAPYAERIRELDGQIRSAW